MESNIENHRVRKVVVYYYLEDGSMHVAEPKQDNSGLPQVWGGKDGGGCTRVWVQEWRKRLVLVVLRHAAQTPCTSCT